MPYFQNVSNQEFQGSWILGDRQYSTNFKIGPNLNSPYFMMAYTAGPYNMSSDNTLTIKYAIDNTLSQFQSLAINVAGVSASATTAVEVADALNANVAFASLWVAEAKPLNTQSDNFNAIPMTVSIRAKVASRMMRAYIVNTSAEKRLQFNKKAPIAQLPTYFSRHTADNLGNFTDCFGGLIELDTGVTYDAAMIDASGQDSGTVKEDWELLTGRSGLFKFRKMTYDGSSRLTVMLEFHAGAKAGDLAMLTTYSYDGSNTSPETIAEQPYTLQNSDLFTP